MLVAVFTFLFGSSTEEIKPMQEQFEQWQTWLTEHPDMDTAVKLGLLLLGAWIANFIVKKVLMRGAMTAISYTPAGKDRELFERNIIARLANVVPALVISYGISSVPGLVEEITIVIANVCNAFVVLTIARAISGTLTVVNT